MNSSYRTPLEIHFGDVDSAGIVYYPRYAHYFHIAMERFFSEALDYPYPRFLDENRIGLPTVRLEVDYRRPLRYGDSAFVDVAIVSLGSTAVVWQFRVVLADETIATEGRVVTVALDIDRFAKTPIPEWLRQGLTRYLESPEDNRVPV